MTRWKAAAYGAGLATLAIALSLLLGRAEGIHPHWIIYPILWVAAFGIFGWEVWDLCGHDVRMAEEYDRARGYDRPLAERAAEMKRLSVGAPTFTITVHRCDCGIGGHDKSCDHTAFCSIWIPASIRRATTEDRP